MPPAPVRLRTSALSALLLLNAGVMAVLGHRNLRMEAALCAGFALLLLAVFAIGRQSLAAAEAAGPGNGAARIVESVRVGALQIGVTYGWGALTLAAAYYLTNLKWYHAYQYSLALCLLAIGWLRLARGLEGRPAGERTMALVRLGNRLAAVQAIATGLAVLLFVGSGKAFSAKSDWLANRVFLFGGMAVAVVSVVLLEGQRRLVGGGQTAEDEAGHPPTSP